MTLAIEGGIKGNNKIRCPYCSKEEVSLYEGHRNGRQRYLCLRIILEFENAFDESVIDTDLVPKRILSTCEFNLDVWYEDQNEFYENASLNILAANYIEKMTAKSDLITVEKLASNSVQSESIVSSDIYSSIDDDENIVDEENDFVTEEFTSAMGNTKFKSPYSEISGDWDSSLITAEMLGGSDGTAENLTATEYIGTDNGAGNRTGIQAFLDNSVVSIMAVPGITDSNVLMTLIAHCENLRNC